ncbi:MAG: aminotransferase class I/II-fold pyridoxal phosphate-dependent enzyme [Nostocoides sp.]
MATDPRGLRADAPLLDAWLAFQERRPTPFTIPGHKQRTDLVGDVVAGDVPYYGGLDTMKVSRGALSDAQQRAAQLWGADVCRFSVGGSSHANQGLMLALGGQGDRVLVGRTLHRSVLLGLVLAGLTPVWLPTRTDPVTGFPVGVTAQDVAGGFEDAPEAVAVLIGDPSYVGTLGDVAGAAQVAHAHNVPLVVDAAWAAHFGFHPDLPAHALACGADALATSAHKTLPAISQGAMVLARTQRIDPARLDAGIEATATTSPAGAILASIDAARALLARDGAALLGEALALVTWARGRLAEVPGLMVAGGAAFDPLKLVLLLAGTGADGVAVEADLLTAGLPVEHADRDTLVAMITMSDGREAVTVLVDHLIGAIERHRGLARPVAPAAAWSVVPEQVCSPREAFFRRHEVIATSASVGRVSGELVAPYPPGVPVLAPGERITAQALTSLRDAAAHGTRIAYAADPTLATLRVLGEAPHTG